MPSTYLLGPFSDYVALVTVLSCLLVGYCTVWVVYTRTFHALANIPGPLWPAVSRT